MKPYLVDVNVWLALLAPRHVHNRTATAWFERIGPGDAGLCRFAQLALIRLLGNAAVMGEGAISAAEAWNTVTTLCEDERVEFLAEPAGIDSVLPGLFRYPSPTNKMVGDAYLAAFAIAAGRRMATMDAGFRQFRGLDVEFLR